MDEKFSLIMRELMKEYQPTIDSIDNEREQRINKAIIMVAIEVSVRAIEIYDSKYGRTSD